MGLTIPCLRSYIGRTIVPGRDANRDSQQSRCLQGFIKLHLEVGSRCVFRATPTYRDYRRVIFGIVNRLGECIQKPVGGGIVRRKIHDKLRARSRSTRHLDVEYNLGIVAIGAARRIRAAVDRYWNHRRRAEAETRKISVQI